MAVSRNTKYTFTTLQDLYIDDSEGEKKCIKKDVKLAYECYLNHILSVSDTCDDRGRVKKDRCRIYHEYDGAFIILGNRVEISELVFGKKTEDTEIGFKSKKTKVNDNRGKVNDDSDAGEASGSK